MNENDHEKKPEEGEAAAPEAGETKADETVLPFGVQRVTPPDDPAAQEKEPQASASEAEAAPAAAPASEPEEGQAPAEAEAEAGSFAWATQPMTAGAAAGFAGAAAAEPEAVEQVDQTQEPAPDSSSEPQAEPEPQPLRIYEYRFIRVKQNAWDSVEATILSTGAAAVADAGGQLYGVWAGQIGLSANQGIVVTVWADLNAAKQHGSAATKGIGDISASETLYLEPTVRPLDPAPPEGPGVFAHRIFEVRRDDADRFVSLSDEAWPQFEEVFGAKIFALWRETGHDRASDRLILLTRYPDYAGWEKSRYWRPDPDPNASDAMARFRERRELTVDTVVYTTRLAAPAND